MALAHAPPPTAARHGGRYARTQCCRLTPVMGKPSTMNISNEYCSVLALTSRRTEMRSEDRARSHTNRCHALRPIVPRSVGVDTPLRPQPATTPWHSSANDSTITHHTNLCTRLPHPRRRALNCGTLGDSGPPLPRLGWPRR